MLRRLIGQESDGEREQITRIVHLIDQFCALLRAEFQDGHEAYEHIYRIAAWADGFKDSLRELEESRYVAAWYSKRVRSSFEEEMQEDERDDYFSHVYFYKNAIIRIFSTLDKLGYFMNETFALRTERVKPRYSFFTVLRQMGRATHLYALYGSLQTIKNEYKTPLDILRKKRNTEIHYVNVEMLDDMKRVRNRFAQRNRIEDLARNVALLEEGCQMVYRTMEAVFEHSSERHRIDPASSS